MCFAFSKSTTIIAHISRISQKHFLESAMLWTCLFRKSIIISWNPIEHSDSQPCTRPPSWGHDGTWRTRESSILKNLARLTTNSHNAIDQSNDRMNLQWELLFFGRFAWKFCKSIKLKCNCFMAWINRSMHMSGCLIGFSTSLFRACGSDARCFHHQRGNLLTFSLRIIISCFCEDHLYHLLWSEAIWVT
jgi:hypothetical protein